MSKESFRSSGVLYVSLVEAYMCDLGFTPVSALHEDLSSDELVDLMKRNWD